MLIAKPAALLAGLAVALLTLAAPVGAATPTGTPGKGLRDVLVVSNNWAGTADVIDVATSKRVKRLNVIPDRAEREAEIAADPTKTQYYDGIKALIGEGNHQFVDDGFTSPDGRVVYFSRPSFADVVAIDLATNAIRWRVPISGYRADHMALSPDGRRLLVSASTAGEVEVIDTAAGRIVASFPSGDQPHESNYSRDGRRIYHASIGPVYGDTDDPSQDDTKGVRVFQIVDARTYRVLTRIDMGKELALYGVGVSASVRPMAISPDERYVYVQLSFLHGFVEYDLQERRPRRLAILPKSAASKDLTRPQYLLDSAHHGLAFNPQGTRLCVAGTMSDYAAIYRRDTLTPVRVTSVGRKPYWSTSSRDGRYCYVSVSKEDRVSVISFATGKEVRRIPVGLHPQRMRIGVMRVAR